MMTLYIDYPVCISVALVSSKKTKHVESVTAASAAQSGDETDIVVY